MDNIKESKEYQLAKDWERAVNDYGFNPKRFAAAIPEMHPTLQQSLYRLKTKVLQVRKPNKYMTRFSFSPMRKPSNYRTMNSSRN